MDIAVASQDTVTVVTISGSLDALNAGQATTFLEERIAAGAVRLVADLSQLEYISSAGLRTLLTALKAARQGGGDLRLAALQDEVRKVLDMAGFVSIVKVYPSVDAATASFA